MSNAASIVRQLLPIGILCFAAACQPPVQPHPHPQQDLATLKIAKVDWSMTRVDRKTLRIEYRVTNMSSQRIYLSDIIYQYQGVERTIPKLQGIAIIQDSEPRVARFMRGRLFSTSPLYLPLFDPGSRPIDPGQTVSGNAQVPLPLKAAHYRGVATVDPLEGKPNAAVLELGYFRVEPHWTDIHLAEGGTIPISSLQDRMETLLSDIKPIP